MEKPLSFPLGRISLLLPFGPTVPAPSPSLWLSNRARPESPRQPSWRSNQPAHSPSFHLPFSLFGPRTQGRHRPKAQATPAPSPSAPLPSQTAAAAVAPNREATPRALDVRADPVIRAACPVPDTDVEDGRPSPNPSPRVPYKAQTPPSALPPRRRPPPLPPPSSSRAPAEPRRPWP